MPTGVPGAMRPPASGSGLRLPALARGAAMGAGGALLLAALLASTSKASLFAAGLALLLAGLAGRRLARWHGPAALLLLNTVILFALLEIGATAVVALATTPAIQARLARIIRPAHDLIAHYRSLPYYAEQEWSERYWEEHERAVRQRYEPYLLWRSPPFHGEAINIRSDGARVTPGARCVPGAYRVFVFGGSAMWGWGAPDWGTIPAYLQAGLEGRREAPVCVVNFAENAYVVTQSLIQLELELEAGSIPDLVVFYHGVNEVLAAHQSGEPLVHQNLPDIAARFEGSRPALASWLLELNLVRLMRRLAGWLGMGARRGAADVDADELGGQVAASYLEALRMVGSLAETYGFEHHFFWQPHILAGAKPLTADERSLITDLDWLVPLGSPLRDLFASTYERIELEASRRERLHYAGRVFDGVRGSVWIDTWGHATPAGNEMVARFILSAIGAQTEDSSRSDRLRPARNRR
ncbi:MAG: SGNH/GDSL hydrolase family protein [Gemmatimonadota bacterium]